MRWFLVAGIVLIIVVGGIILSMAPSQDYLLEDATNSLRNVLLIEPVLFNHIPDVTQTGQRYVVTRKDGNESFFDVTFRDLNTEQTEILFTLSQDRLREYQESDESLRSFNYTPSRDFPIRIQERERTDTNQTNRTGIRTSLLTLVSALERDDTTLRNTTVTRETIDDTFQYRFIANKSENEYIKFGENSIEIELQAVYSTTDWLTNVTSEPNNVSHLSVYRGIAPYQYLVSYYSFDAANENVTAYDFVGTDEGSFENMSINTTNCVYGNCVNNIEGTVGGSVVVPDSPSTRIAEAGESFAVSMWVRPGASIVSSTEMLGTESTVNTVQGWQVGLASDYQVSFRLNNGTSGSTGVSGIAATQITSLNWTHIVVMLDAANNNASIWLNGQFAREGTSALGGSYEKNVGYNIGKAENAGRYFNGSVDEVMLFNSTLNSSQILEIYQNTSKRFSALGYQSSNRTINFTEGYNRVNVTFDNQQKNMGTNISFALGYQNATGWFMSDYQNVTENTVLIYNISITASNLSLNYTFYPTPTTRFYTPLIGGNVSLTLWNVTGGSPPDTDAPKYFNATSNFANATEYAPNRFYEWNITITDDVALETVKVAFNGGANETPYGSYAFNRTNLAAGAYPFLWTANDTAGNRNDSLQSYTIIQNSSYRFNVTFGGTSANTSVGYGAGINITTVGFKGELFQDGANVTGSIGNIFNLSVGTYNFTGIFPANQNYTAKEQTYFLTVTQATSAVNLTLNHTASNITITEDTAIAINGSILTGQGNNINVFVEGIGIIYNGTSPSFNLTNFTTPGTYNVSVFYFETVNYTGSSLAFWVNVTQGSIITPPDIAFVSPTPNNASTQASTTIPINISSSDTVEHYVVNDKDNGIIAWWRMDDQNSSGDVLDISGNALNATLKNGAAINETGRWGDSASLDGTNDYLRVPDNNLLDPTTLTVSFWANVRAFSTFDNVISHGNDASGWYVQSLGGSNPGRVLFCTTGCVFSTTKLTQNAWTHIVIVHNGTTDSIYLNGNLNETIADTNVVTNFAGSLFVGVNISTGNAFDGSLDEIILFNRSLSSQEVSSLYNATASQYSNDFTELSEGTYRFTAYGVNDLGAKNQTDERIITVDLAPIYSDLTENPADPATYAAGQVYEFNATWTDTIGVQAVRINFSGSLYTPSVSGSRYNFSIEDLAAGTYSYTWTANDSAGNTNTTPSQTYTISKAAGSVFSFIDHERSDKTVGNGTNVSLNGTLEAGVGDIILTVNESIWNTGASPLYNNSQFNVGTYSINISYQGNQNYTAAEEIWVLSVIVPTPASNATVSASACRYKQFGYYNLRLPWIREVNCL